MVETGRITYRQAEELQRSRQTAEMSVLALFESTGVGGGGGDLESSTLNAVKLTPILTAMAVAVVHSNLGRDVDVDIDSLVDQLRAPAGRVFERLDSSEIPVKQRATLWATWSHSEITSAVASTVDDTAGLKKVWISRADANVRKLHAKLHGKTVPVDEDFWRWPHTGKRLRWPGDEEAPLDAVIGCRCISLLTWSTQNEVSDVVRRIVQHTSA